LASPIVRNLINLLIEVVPIATADKTYGIFETSEIKRK